MTHRIRRHWLSVVAMLACAATLGAQAPPPARGVTSDAIPRSMDGVRLEQRLDAALPLDTSLIDERGLPVALGEFFGRRPVVLAFVYFECPMLCSQVLQGLVRGLRPLSLTAGDAFELVVISFDPRNKPADAMMQRELYARRYGRDGARGLHFLTGTPEAVHAVTSAAGFGFRFDESSGLFFHPAAVVVATPGGRISRYLTGIDYAPRDLKFALMEASASRIGTLADRLQLYCYQYDPASGSYGVMTFRLLRIAGVLTIGAMAMLIGGTVWRERRRHASEAGR